MSTANSLLARPLALLSLGLLLACAPPVRADTGICCNFITGSCFVSTQFDCPAASKDWFPNGSCTPNACPPVGACCDSEDACTQRTQDHCIGAFGGISWQPQTACTPTKCLPLGRCCNFITGSCSVTQHPDCPSASKDWSEGSSCMSSQCDPIGACCDDSGTCTRRSQRHCAASWTTDAACSPNLCGGLGRCCNFFTGSCLVSLHAACPSASKDWFAGGSCTPGACPGIGSCCYQDSGVCVYRSVDHCTAPGGYSWTLGGACSPNPCGSPLGRCCNFITGACALTLRSECGLAAHTWGSGTTCTPNTCAQPGACCGSDGSCRRLTQAHCSSAAWFDGACGTNPCSTVAFAAKWADPFSGARAVALFDLALPPVLLNPGDNSNGFGTTLRNLQLLVYGASLGNGVFRQSDFDHMVLSTDLAVDVSAEWVGQPQQNDARWGRTPGGGGPMLRIGPSEPDFNLFLLTPGAPNGTWYFQLTTNSGRSETIRLTSFAPLPAPGACCAVSGACTLSPDPVCLFNGGTPLAAGTVCAPNPCTRQGRCCNFVTGSCSMAYLNACGAAAHTWTPQGACSPNPCAPVGSCCIDGAACRRLAQSLCVSFDGAWSLGGVCTPSPCMSPAALAVTPCPADFNHSGSVDAADMFDFLNAWLAADQRADFNGEGRTSVLILLDFTNAWLHGCAENSPPVSTIPAEARRSGYPAVHPRD